VTVDALAGRVLVNHHILVCHQPHLGMTFATGNVGMTTCQSEVGPGVVVERRRCPPLNSVAVSAMGLPILGDELPVVRIQMARLALHRRAFESGFVVCRGLVAIRARDRPMSSQQLEFCFGVIESADFAPSFHVVASLAPKGRSIRALPGHLPIELAMMGILVARGATLVLEMERQDFIGSTTEPNLVAIRAGNRRVRALQWEVRVAVLGDCEGGPMEVGHRMAILAAILVGSGGELIVVGIFMAIAASREFHLINRIFPLGNVALCAFHLRVLAL